MTFISLNIPYFLLANKGERIFKHFTVISVSLNILCFFIVGRIADIRRFERLTVQNCPMHWLIWRIVYSHSAQVVYDIQNLFIVN